MNIYQSFLQTNTKTGNLFKYVPVKVGFIILSLIGVLRIPEEFYLYKDKVGTLKIEKHTEWSSENLVTPYFQFIFKIFLKSVTLCLITNPYNPKYSRLQNKKRFHVNANGHLRMYCLRHQLTWALI